MYPTEYDEFVKLLTDLCISTNRPCTNDLVRVFWEDLQHVPFKVVQRQAALLRTKGQMKFSSNDLRPPPEERSVVGAAFDNNVTMTRLTDYVNRHYWHRLSHMQRLCMHTFIFSGPREAPRCTGLRFEQDGDYPQILVRVEDLALDSAPLPTRDDVPMQSRENWNEADAVRDVLNRKS